VAKYSGGTGTFGYVDSGNLNTARFSRPTGIVYDSGSGNLLIGDTNNHTVRKITIGSTTAATLAGLGQTSGSVDGSGSAAGFYQPGQLAYDSANTYVADAYNHTIRKIVTASGA